MQKDLLEELVGKPQRETAGPDTASRFDYQKNWAFCQMLRRHMDNADYVVAFEFHEDVLFLAPSAATSTAEFFQVKTSSSAKPRKLADLTALNKKPNSILGKMFLNFGGMCFDYTVRVILVSNVAFEFADKDLSAKDLHPKYRAKIIDKLKAEISGFSEAQVDNLHFIVTGVSIDAMQSFLQGEAMDLFRSRFGEDHGFNVHSWIRLLQGEISRKNNYPSDKISNVADLISKKCISRQTVDDTLAVVAAGRKAAPDMALVNEELKAAGWTTQDLMRLNKRLPQATADYTDATNVEVLKIVEALDALLEAHIASISSFATLVGLAEKSILPTLSHPYNDRPYLAALSLWVYHEAI